ncbi:hypothetical protein RW64_18560 [Geobacter sulfurreducens]|nr:hypothetical protein RW64_18560 [Geobacter sulfurreducens]
MAQIDETRKDWIKRNLTIRHNQLTREEARDWLRLMMADMESFLAHAIYGYLLQRISKEGTTRIPQAEVAEFCEEFILKIQLANRNIRITVSFPLFGLVGHDVLSKFGFMVAKPTVLPGGVA